ncbi:MAG: RDD family protein [Oceanicoccus sp.]
MKQSDYAGFWVRVAATIIDSVLIMIVITPLFLLLGEQSYGANGSIIPTAWDLALNYCLPALAIILFWIYKSSTPGKMIFKLKIVDAKTGEKPTGRQLVGRYFAYYISILPFMLGLVWVAIDNKKQGWHDKLAGTLVIKDKTNN